MKEFVAPPIKDLFGSETIGIWVSKSGADHVGVTYKISSQNGRALGVESDAVASDLKSNSQSFELHFLDDDKILNDPVDWSTTTKQRLVAVVEVDEFAKISFPVYLHTTVAKSSLRFGIDWLGNIGSIDENGVYVPPVERPGFTCATYLCEVFRSHGLEVVNEHTWPKNAPESENWLQKLRARFKQKSDRQLTIKNIEDTQPVVRLMPAEFAGAASFGSDAWPVSRIDANAIALQITQDFNAKFGAV